MRPGEEATSWAITSVALGKVRQGLGGLNSEDILGCWVLVTCRTKPLPQPPWVGRGLGASSNLQGLVSPGSCVLSSIVGNCCMLRGRD